jgi:hypothetical protein
MNAPNETPAQRAMARPQRLPQLQPSLARDADGLRPEGLGRQARDRDGRRRRARWQPRPPRFGRGYGWTFSQHIPQANDGCDMDFLRTEFGPTAGEPDIF